MYFFISIAALAFTLIVMMCTGMLFSAVVVSFSFFVFFFVCFFFDSIDDRNIECFMLSLFSRSSYSLLQSTLVAYSYVFLILHLRVLFRCVPYVYFVLKRKKKRIAKRIISTRLSYVEVEKREILVNSFVALTEHYRD